MSKVADQRLQSAGKVCNFLKLSFRHSGIGTRTSSANPAPSSSSSMASHNVHHHRHHYHFPQMESLGSSRSSNSVASSLLATRRRLKLDPSNKLYFPYEPGKLVRSAIRIENTSKSQVAFKFQTTEPKSCFMRPPGGLIAPGKSIIATVFKFAEPPENNGRPKKTHDKFKIMSLKVKGEIIYAPELFDEQKDQVFVERILQVAFIDPKRPTPALEKVNRYLAEADTALEALKKPPKDPCPKIIQERFALDEWRERRQRYLAKQKVEAGSSR